MQKCEATIKLNKKVVFVFFFFGFKRIYHKEIYFNYHYTFTGKFLHFHSDKMRIKKLENSVDTPQTICRVSV